MNCSMASANDYTSDNSEEISSHKLMRGHLEQNENALFFYLCFDVFVCPPKLKSSK